MLEWRLLRDHIPMALKATIYKAELQISDLDRNYYETHAITLARHPSENDLRMVVRMLAFVLNAHEQLDFGKGLSDEDDAALWQKNYTGEIEHWIDVGRPDEDRIRRASARAKDVSVYSYGDNACDMWWQAIEPKLSRFSNVRLWRFRDQELEPLVALTQRNMHWQCTLQDGHLFLHIDGQSLTIQPEPLG